MTHPALDSPESRACIEALYNANPEGTAELMLAFPEAVFSWLKVSLEGSSRPAGNAGSASQPQVEGYGQGRLL